MFNFKIYKRNFDPLTTFVIFMDSMNTSYSVVIGLLFWCTVNDGSCMSWN